MCFRYCSLLVFSKSIIVASTSWVISDNRKRDFFICRCRSWCVSDIVADLMTFHCQLDCLLGWAWLSVVFLAVGILRAVVWGGLLFRVVLHRLAKWLVSWWVRICYFRVMSDYYSWYYDLVTSFQSEWYLTFLWKSFLMISSRGFTNNKLTFSFVVPMVDFLLQVDK